MIEIFKAAIQRGASDIHIKAGDFIRARINGELLPLTQQRLTPEKVEQICLQLIPHQSDRDRIDEIRPKIAADMRAALSDFVVEDGSVVAPASTWAISARAGLKT